MAVKRLALSMAEDVVVRARRLAEARNPSVSRLFVSFVCLMAKRPFGLVKSTLSDDWGYREDLSDALVEKYGM